MSGHLPIAILQGPPTRSCGDCRLCCKVMAIHELEKPRGEWCPHACSKGCGIYSERPQSCRDFICCWLAGWFQEDERPDRSKVVFSFAGTQEDGKTPTMVRNPETGGEFLVLACQESYEGASLSGKGLKLVEFVLAQGVAVVVNGSDRPKTLFFPDGYYMNIRKGSPDAAFDGMAVAKGGPR